MNVEQMPTCPHCGSEMRAFALPKGDGSGKWSGVTKCINASCKASGPLVCGEDKGQAVALANAAALRRYDPTALRLLRLPEAISAEHCYIELKSAQPLETSKYSVVGRVDYSDDRTKARIWRIGYSSPLYAALELYGKTWRCWSRAFDGEGLAGMPWEE